MTIKDAKLNIYELNKQIISQLPPLDPVKFNDAVDTINNWCKGHTYMLYGKEISYFTLFQKEDNKNNEFADLGHAVLTVAQDISKYIYSCDVVDDGSAIEIWIKYDKAPTVLYLFDYENGIVKYGKE